MNFLSSLLILCLLTIGCNVNAQNTKCFQCNELSDPGCRDPFAGDQEFVKDCENGETFCRKMVQYVNGRSSVVRQCAKELYKPDFEGCYKTAGKSTQTVCTCKSKDGKPCNNGIAFKSSILAIALSVILANLLKY